MEVDGIEPTTPCLQSRCSPTELHPQETQTDERKSFFSVEKNQKTFINTSQSRPNFGGPGRI